jgi:hypothetical protein
MEAKVDWEAVADGILAHGEVAKVHGIELKVVSIEKVDQRTVIISGTDASCMTDTKKIVVNALKAGHSVEVGSIVFWVAHDIVCDITKEGSKQYTWDSSGTKILCEMFLFTRHAKNDMPTRLWVGKMFKTWAAAWGD